MKNFSIIFLLITFPLLVHSQLLDQQKGEQPPSLAKQNSGLIEHDLVETKNINSVDLTILNKARNSLAKDSIRARPLPVGVNIDVNYNMKNSGSVEYLENGTKIYRLHIVSKGAKKLFVMFNSFSIPKLAKLYLYDKQKKQIIGPHSCEDNNSSGSFSAGPIVGDELYIEYVEPKSVKFKGSFNIFRIAHIAENLNSNSNKALGDADPCHINIMCPEGDGWCNQRRSVAKIWILTSLSQLNYVATGSLITNEKRDSRPYLITAGHCADIDGNNGFSSAEMNDVQNWVFTFNYQSSTCSNPPSDPYTTTYNISGATWVSGNMNMDFALLELSIRPPGNYNTFYNGWDNEKVLWDDGKLIHHPAGDIKKITRWSKNTQLTPNYFRRYHVTAGGIEGGSSGAPAYNNDKYLVGVHSASQSNSSACDQSAYRLYGRFCKMWDDGSNPSLRTFEKLNPNGTSSHYITSMSGDEPCKEFYYFNNASDLHTSANVTFTNPSSIGTRSYNGYYEVTNEITATDITVLNNTSVTFDAGNRIILYPDCHIESGANFHAFIDGCERGCGNGKSGLTSSNKYEMNIYSQSDSIKNKSSSMDDEIIAFPNPANNLINIHSNNNPILSLELISSLGKTVLKKQYDNLQNVQLNISSFDSGIYFIRVQTDKRIKVFKIFIK